MGAELHERGPGRAGGAIVYATLDGVTTHLGYSQIVRPLVRLAERGYEYHVVSLEPPGASEERIEAITERFRRARITWRWEPYREGFRGAARNVGALARMIAARPDAALVHARSYLPALAARALGAAYLFDTRGYWFDEKLAAGRWFSSESSATFRGARRLERALFSTAAGVVNLSESATEDVRSGRFGPWSEARLLSTIPTLVDYDDFGAPGPAPPELASFCAEAVGARVIGYIGSLNASYHIGETLRLMRYVQDLDNRARVLGLTSQPAALARAARAAGLDMARVMVMSAPHEQMPAWLARVDWGAALVKRTPAKRASMPTKLGEFFAAGIRPVQYGCNRDARRWTERAGSGIVLDELSDDALRAAARRIAQTPPGRGREQERAKRRTRAHFDLAGGVDRYDRLIEALLCAGR